MSESKHVDDELFHAAREIEDPGQRAIFLNNACRNDAALRQRLEELLNSQTDADHFFRPLRPRETTSAPARAEAEPPEFAGRYRLLERIGEGGFGIVYRAEQIQPVRRQVALKILLPGMATRLAVARFEAERQVLAMMDHPNIAMMFDGGLAESSADDLPKMESASPGGQGVGALPNGGEPGQVWRRPYFVMELVEGIPITQFCVEHRLRTEQRLQLFIQVCEAIQHAHQKGIIHRDIKPSNVLVSLQDGKPVPKVIDFGVAKAVQQNSDGRGALTQVHQLIGTPAYMSPEQAEGSGDVDTRSDIYSLGVLLYELLTGGPPFDGKQLLASGLDALRRILRETEPERPSTRLQHEMNRAKAASPGSPSIDDPKAVVRLRGDLDWVVLKCLEKDRKRRYETANGLVMDLRRHLANEPVEARPPSAAYRFQKTIRRHRAAFVAAALVAVALIGGGVVSTWMLFRERAARHQSEERLRAALEFVETIVEKVAPDIANLSGAAKPYATIGHASLDVVNKLRSGAENDSALRVTLVKTLTSLSLAQNPGSANPAGNYAAARNAAEEAIELLKVSNPRLDEADRLNRLVSARLGLIQSLYGLGDLDKAITNSLKLLAFMESVAPESKAGRSKIRERWNIRGNITYAHLLSGRIRESIEQANKILDSPWSREAGESTSTDELETLANTRLNLAAAYGLLDDFDIMRTHASEAYRLWLRIVELARRNVRYELGLAEGISCQGWALVRSGHPREGWELLNQGRNYLNELIGRDPDNDAFQVSLAISAATQALACLGGLEGEEKAPSNPAQRLGKAMAFLAEADRFAHLAKGKEAESRVNLARAKLTKAAQQAGLSDHKP